MRIENPERSGRTESPERSRRTESPEQSGRTESPERSRRTESPEQSGRTESPEQSEGFTLIELLVVIAIIGILTSIVLVVMGGAKASARDAKRQADLYQISNAMELCYEDKACAGGQQYLVAASPEGPATIGPYMNPVPGDPVNVAPHRYIWSDNSAALSQYCVSAKLEADNVFIAVSEQGTKFNLTAQPPSTLTPTTSCW